MVVTPRMRLGVVVPLVIALTSLQEERHQLFYGAGVVHALSSFAASKPDFKGGAGVGRLVLDADTIENWQCHYDMVLTERIQGRSKQDSGLFIPDDTLPRLHLCKVLSVGPGREEENGRVTVMPDITVGDIVIAKNPWGIGPKDEETADGRKLSYMRSQDIAAKISGGILPED